MRELGKKVIVGVHDSERLDTLFLFHLKTFAGNRNQISFNLNNVLFFYVVVVGTLGFILINKTCLLANINNFIITKKKFE